MSYHLAIDIGASSGRHILGEHTGGEIKLTEIYRFENEIKNVNGTLCWDIEHITKQVIEGIRQCGLKGYIPKTVAIDTWGVDYVLLDKNKKEILPVVSYRDSRTNGVPEKVDQIISKSDLYKKTGIQRVNFNSIYQLFCDKESGRLNTAEHLLMIPEYLTYKLTGVIKNEYTAATTTALINAEQRTWDYQLIDLLGFNRNLFKKISQPGSVLGGFTKEVKDRVGFDSTVVFAPSHDTASAVAACTLQKHSMYISSGTWSLIGSLNNRAVLTKDAEKANFTNEGGVGGTYRFLKNIMGMWLFQSIRKNLNKEYTYDQMMHLAMESEFTKTFDPNDSRLLAPESMIDAVKDCLGKPNLPLGDVINSVYHSLAKSYAKVVKEIESITGEEVDLINIVGGGSKDTYLNSLTEKYTGKPIMAGPVEATATGNLLTQINTKI